MSDTDGELSPADDDITALTGDMVASYLDANPNFLVERPDVVANLELPVANHGQNVTDFQSFALSRLRKQVADMRTASDEFLSITRSNHSSQTQVHEAVLALLDARGFDHLVHVVTSDWVDILGVDAISLCLEVGSQRFRFTGSGIQRLAAGGVAEALGEDSAIVLRDKTEGSASIFGAAAPSIRAEALIKLALPSPLPSGLLGFGSQDAQGFHPAQGTELMRFLAAVLARSIERWLTQDPG
ncbi:MAG: DUF484 family protein [Pseudomonadota bacterium]